MFRYSDLKRKLQEYKKTAPIPTECLISYSNVAQSTSSLESSDHLDIEVGNNFGAHSESVINKGCFVIPSGTRNSWFLRFIILV